MKTIHFIWITCMTFFVSCSQPKDMDESKDLINVLTDYFNAVKKNDLALLNEHTTADFLLFENGKVWNNDSLHHDLQNYKDTRIEFKLHDFKILVNEGVGHVAYYNQGDVYKNDTLLSTLHWIENAVFKKEGNQWKIYFLQSTPRASN